MTGTSSPQVGIRRPEVRYSDLPSRDDTLPSEVLQQVEIALKYEGYIDRQTAEVEKFKTLEEKCIPPSLVTGRIKRDHPGSKLVPFGDSKSPTWGFGLVLGHHCG